MFYLWLTAVVMMDFFPPLLCGNANLAIYVSNALLWKKASQDSATSAGAADIRYFVNFNSIVIRLS